MKLAISLTLSFFSLLTFHDKSFSLTNNQIDKICKKEKKIFTCKKNLQEKRKNLKKGNLIEIPVIPYEG